MFTWLYEIWLNGFMIGDQGEVFFDTEQEAKEDARHFIEVLSSEHNEPKQNFRIQCFCVQR